MKDIGHPLVGMLALAVSLEIDRLRALGDDIRDHLIAQNTGEDVADLIGTHGDDLLFGGPHCVEAFAVLARALACLAWQPGGVDFAGLHFCAHHELCLAAQAELEAAS